MESILRYRPLPLSSTVPIRPTTPPVGGVLSPATRKKESLRKSRSSLSALWLALEDHHCAKEDVKVVGMSRASGKFMGETTEVILRGEREVVGGSGVAVVRCSSVRFIRADLELWWRLASEPPNRPATMTNPGSRSVSHVGTWPRVWRPRITRTPASLPATYKCSACHSLAAYVPLRQYRVHRQCPPKSSMSTIRYAARLPTECQISNPTQLAFYGAYHSNKINIAIHIICVPIIMW